MFKSVFGIKQEAQTFAIRLTVHHKPYQYTGEICALMGAAPIIDIFALSRGGEVRLSSNMSLRSFRIASAKVVKKIEIAA